ncbi:MAG TPA: phospholipid carrier-dependent glycosyltransferase [Candidatus Acidoferrales bacterium]|nr:phospholipid carrier-dependent glycosyltransferase [Candidatus Acidoferrales bacterium]
MADAETIPSSARAAVANNGSPASTELAAAAISPTDIASSSAEPITTAGTYSAAENTGEIVFPKLLVAGIVLLILASYFVLIGLCPLVEPDEPRYAEIAREMIELRDWVTPHLNYVKYFEKPPLIYWLTAAHQMLFGYSELVARLWPVIFALLGIGSVTMLGRNMFGRGIGFLAAAILAASPLYFALGQVLILDMPLSSLMTLGFAAFWMAYNSPHHRRPWVLSFYFVLALAMLTKGPVAVVLTGAVLLAFILLRRDFASLRWILSPSAIGLFCVVALPWFLLVSWRNPEFVDFFVVKQHINRYIHPDEHQQSVLFFIPILLGGMLPWSFLLLAAPQRAREILQRALKLRMAPATLYCVLWAAIIFLFFSLSGSKLATYILPVFPPLALLAARFIALLIQRDELGAFRRSARLFQGMAAALVVGGVVSVFFVEKYQSWIVIPRLMVGAAILALSSRFILRDVSRQDIPPQRRSMRAFVAIVVTILALQTVALSGRSAGQHYEQIGRTIGAEAKPDDTVVVYGHYTQGIPYYSKRRVVMVRAWGELDFGARQGDQSQFFWPNDEQLLQAWNSGRRMFLVINRNELAALNPPLQPPPRELVAQDKKVLVVNFAAR